MRYLMLLSVSVFLLSGCSLFKRSPEMNPALAVADNDGENFAADDTSGQQIEGEVAKMNTKIEALQTKLDVLTMAFEKMQAQKSQPLISAEGGDSWDTSAQPTLAAPVNDLPTHVREASQPVKQISAAPSPPARGNAAIESSFRKAMTEFQQGHYRDAAQQFTAVAQMDPNHLLSAHALYWSGEANARNQQWSSAIENWQGIEKNYPTSTYVPEALAGLAKAYEMQGDTAKANSYRNVLARAFPNSPVALANASSAAGNTELAPQKSNVEEHDDEGMQQEDSNE